MKPLMSILVILLLSISSSSQYSNLINNRHIIWAAEQTDIVTLTEDLIGYPKRIFEKALRKEILVKDKNGIVRNDDLILAYSGYDTVWQINPITLSEKTRIVENNWNHSEEQLIVRRYWYYNKKAHKLYSEIKWKTTCNVGGRFSNFYLYENNVSKIKECLKFENITKNSYLDNKINLFECKNNVQFIKLIYSKELSQVLIEEVESNNLSIHSIESGNKLIYSHDLMQYTDTVWQINPITLEHEEIIIGNHYNNLSVEYYELVENWCVDQKTLSISSEIISITPVFVRYVNQDSSFSEKLFVIKF